MKLEIGLDERDINTIRILRVISELRYRELGSALECIENCTDAQLSEWSEWFDRYSLMNRLECLVDNQIVIEESEEKMNNLHLEARDIFHTEEETRSMNKRRYTSWKMTARDYLRPLNKYENINVIENTIELNGQVYQDDRLKMHDHVTILEYKELLVVFTPDGKEIAELSKIEVMG